MNSKYTKAVYLVLFIITLVIITCAAKNPLEQNVCLNQQNMKEFDTEWRRTDTNELVEIGGRKQYETEDTFRVYRSLPDDITDEDNLILSSSHAHIEVFIDGKMIYEYGKQTKNWLVTPGSAWLIVPLHKEYQGKEILISATSHISKYKGRMCEIYISDRASALLFIMEENQIGILTGYMILTLGVLLFIIWLVCLRVNNIRKLLYLSMFSIVLYTWSLGETSALQFNVGNMRAASVLSFELIILLQFPMMLFYSIDENNEERPRFKKFLYIPVFNFIICNYLFLVHHIDFTQTIIVTHISLALCTLACVYTIYKEKSESLGKRFYSIKQWRLDSWGFVFMIVMASADIVRYYTAYYSDSAMYSRFGLLFFILTLGIQTVNNAIRAMLETQKNKIYKHMAYHDCLTQLYNRAAYEKKIHELDELPDELENTCVIAVDINNLKYVNDTYGHAKGDQFIVQNANYCLDLFGDIGDCYRIGGDEFVIISPGKNAEQFKERLLRLESEEFSKNNFAYGFAKFDHEVDQTVLDIITRADKKMYQNKKMYH